MNKPAACIYNGDFYKFISWPFGLSKPNISILSETGIDIVTRSDFKNKDKNSSVKMRWEIENSRYIATLINTSLEYYFDSQTHISFEGLSFASGGNAGTQLAGYKYILMDRLELAGLPLENMFTYAPQTLKSVAGCAGKDPLTKKQYTKSDMIKAFMQENINCEFKDNLAGMPEYFQTAKGNWIAHLDDVIDSYYAVKAHLVKSGLF